MRSDPGGVNRAAQRRLRGAAILARMTMLSLLDAQLAFGDVPLLDRAQLAVGDGDRIGLIGRNGSGKSSLLAVIAGRIALDGGELKRRDGLHVVLVEQEPALPAARTLRESLLARGGIERMHDERERWRTEARLAEKSAPTRIVITHDRAVVDRVPLHRRASGLLASVESRLCWIPGG